MRDIILKVTKSALLRCERAATAVEYGLICALIVLAMMTALKNFATKANVMWYNIANEVSKH